MARGGYRPGSGPAKGTKYKPRAPKSDNKTVAMAKTKTIKKPKVPDDIQDAAAAKNLTPLEYMLKVMNDATETDNARKDRMAIAAAPFCHSRKGEGAGKKEERDGKAKQAGAGKFAPAAPPRLVSVNK